MLLLSDCRKLPIQFFRSKLAYSRKKNVILHNLHFVPHNRSFALRHEASMGSRIFTENHPSSVLTFMVPWYFSTV